MSITSGKALMNILRDGDICRLEHLTVLTPSEYAAHESAKEALECCDYIAGAMPSAALRLRDGERIIVKVNFSVAWSQDYWGEWDFGLDYTKQKVICRRMAR